MICLISSVDERDLSLLNSVKYDSYLITSNRLCVYDAREFEAVTGL